MKIIIKIKKIFFKTKHTFEYTKYNLKWKNKWSSKTNVSKAVCLWVYGCVVIVSTVEGLYLKMTQCELRLMSVYASSLIQQQRSDFLTSDLQDAKIVYAREMLCQFCNYFCTHIWF